MTCSSDFWDALAPQHSKIENSYFDLPSLRRILGDIILHHRDGREARFIAAGTETAPEAGLPCRVRSLQGEEL